MLRLYRSWKLVWITVVSILAQPKMLWGLPLPVPNFSSQVCSSCFNENLLYVFALLFLHPFPHSTHCVVAKDNGRGVVRQASW